MLGTLLRLALVLLPWRLRRPLLVRLYGYRLHRDSHVGLAWVYPRLLTMEEGARIGHLTVCKGLERLALGAHASIGRLNWISGYPLGRPPHFLHLSERMPELVLGEHSAITNRHIIDCTQRVTVGRFTTVAGFRSQILTHSIDIRASRQDAHPVSIGDYCFLGTACTVLGGSVLPDFSVLGAHSLLNKPYAEPYTLYAGVPARPVSVFDRDSAYFRRAAGFVV